MQSVNVLYMYIAHIYSGEKDKCNAPLRLMIRPWHGTLIKSAATDCICNCILANITTRHCYCTELFDKHLLDVILLHFRQLL